MISEPHAAAGDSERRVAPRVRTLKQAKILFNNRYSTFDCTVRNISATGALLTIDRAVPLPKVFEIRIGDGDPVRPAKLVYRRDSFAGIHFLDTGSEGEGVSSMEEGPIPSASGDLRIHPRPLPAGLARHFPWA